MQATSPDLTMIRHWLLEANPTPILEIAENKNGILSQLTAVTYDGNIIISDRAVEASGLAAQVIAKRDPEFVRNYLLRLFWLLNDESGGIGWRAPELIGEILHRCPQFDQFFPMLIALLGLEEEESPRFQAGTLWAIGRVAQTDRNAMLPALPRVQEIISDAKLTDENIKERGKWCLNQMT